MSATKKNWTYDEVHALIQAVRKNPSLYDRRDPDYNQMRTKEVRFYIELQNFFWFFIEKNKLMIWFSLVLKGHLEENLNKWFNF